LKKRDETVGWLEPDYVYCINSSFSPSRLGRGSISAIPSILRELTCVSQVVLGGMTTEEGVQGQPAEVFQIELAVQQRNLRRCMGQTTSDEVRRCLRTSEDKT